MDYSWKAKSSNARDFLAAKNTVISDARKKATETTRDRAERACGHRAAAAAATARGRTAQGSMDEIFGPTLRGKGGGAAALSL